MIIFVARSNSTSSSGLFRCCDLNRRQYAITLVSFSKLEYHWLGRVSILKTKLLRLSGMVLGSLSCGQLDSSCVNYESPACQILWFVNAVGSNPLDIASVRLSFVGTCLDCSGKVLSLISAVRFATKVFNDDGCVCIQWSTVMESVQKIAFLILIYIA